MKAFTEKTAERALLMRDLLSDAEGIKAVIKARPSGGYVGIVSDDLDPQVVRAAVRNAKQDLKDGGL